jgi:hypothetical protein
LAEPIRAAGIFRAGANELRFVVPGTLRPTFPDGCDHAAGWTDSTHAYQGQCAGYAGSACFHDGLSGNRHIALASGAGEVDYLTKPTNMRNCSTTSGVHFANACTARSVCTATGHCCRRPWRLWRGTLLATRQATRPTDLIMGISQRLLNNG